MLVENNKKACMLAEYTKIKHARTENKRKHACRETGGNMPEQNERKHACREREEACWMKARRLYSAVTWRKARLSVEESMPALIVDGSKLEAGMVLS